MQKTSKLIALGLMSACSIISLTGCSRLLTSKMPTGNVSMKQAYENAINGSDEAMAESTLDRARAAIHSLKQQLPDYNNDLRTSNNHIIDTPFTRLPNPNVVLYVYPHQAGVGDNQTPVPGYLTVFPLYQHVYYAMSSDIST